MTAILEVYNDETKVRSRKIEDDPERGANIFNVSHRYYTTLQDITNTYNYECSDESLQ